MGHWRRQVTWSGRRRAAALLEVVIAISILLVAMSVVGATFRNGAHNVELAERMNQASSLTDRLLTELDLGLAPILQPVEAGDAAASGGQKQELTGWFGEDAPPGMSWKVEAEPDILLPDIFKVGVHIYLGDPDAGEDRTQRLLSTYVLRAVPRTINLETDFGFSEEQLTMLTDAIPGGAAVFDPTNFDPRTIASLPLDQLQELLPMLMAALGGGAMGGQFDSLLQAAQRGDLSGIQDLARQLGTLQQAQGGGQIPGLPGMPGQGGVQPPGQQPGGEQPGQGGRGGRGGGGRK